MPSQEKKIMHLSLNETSGFGVTVHLIAQVLSGALREGRTLVMHGPWSYFRHRGCRGPGRSESLACHFEPAHGDCPASVLWDPTVTPIFTANYQLYHDWHIPVRFAGPPPPQTDSSGSSDDQLYSGLTPGKAISEQQGEAELGESGGGGGGVFFFVSQLSAFLLSPNRRTDAMLRRVRRSIGYRHPIIGVHVRHGDSCPKWSDAHSHLPGAKCEALERYILEMRRMGRQYGVRRAFFCTDDPGVIHHLPAAAAAADAADAADAAAHASGGGPVSGGGHGSGWEIVHLQFDRRLFSDSDWATELRLLMATVDRRAVSETTLADLLLLAEADYLVGTLSSHFGALAYELSVAAKGYYPPYISLDFPWGASLLAPVQYYRPAQETDGNETESAQHDQPGATETVARMELNPRRRDFGARRPPVS